MAWYDFFLGRKRQRRDDQQSMILTPSRIGRQRGNVESVLPRFHSSATDFAMIGRAESRRRSRLRDAFTPSRPVLDIHLFAGRKDVLQTLIRSIEDLRLHVVVYGDRGMGKTSMLHVVSYLARAAHYHVCYHSCGATTGFSDIFRAIAGDIPLLYHGQHDPTAEETERGGTIADLLPSGDFGVNQLSEVLAHLSNTRVLIILDEFDRSPPGEFRRSIAELIKTLSDRNVRVQLLIGGVAGNLTELIEHIPSIRRNIYGLRMPSMGSDEVREIIRIGEAIGEINFDDEAIEQVVGVANGYPYLASLLSQYAGFAAVDREADSVGLEDVVRATHQVYDEIGERLSDRTRAIVDGLIEHGEGPQLLTLAAAAMAAMGRLIPEKLAEWPGEPDIATYLGQLRDRHGLIEQVPGDVEEIVRFREEAVPTYVWIMHASGRTGTIARQGRVAGG